MICARDRAGCPSCLAFRCLSAALQQAFEQYRWSALDRVNGWPQCSQAVIMGAI